jgi:glycosyltransferase involved in cell wall biosynthesis
MRIGIDMLSLQSPGSRGRGVGRFGENLVDGLLTLGHDHHFIFYGHGEYPDDRIPQAPNATREPINPDPARGEHRIRDAMERLARTNPHGVDAFLLIHPFELCPGYEPPARPLNGPRMVSVVHDLIPFLFPEQYLADPPNAAWNYRRLHTLRHYDALLTNSESTRRDCLRILGIPGDRVTTIGGAADGSFWYSDRTSILPRESQASLERYEIRKPFLFTLGGDDPRKNLSGLVKAFALLPMELREAHQLVIACYLREQTVRELREQARQSGLSDADLVLAGEVADVDLRVFYQRCAAFVFPSRYEGLGLPLLEAMHCGAAVIAGNNSSQVEVVGDAGLLVDVDDAFAVAHAMTEVLRHPTLALRLGEQGEIRARQFNWGETSRRAIDALTRLVASPGRMARARATKPRIAVVSPWPPKRSAVSGYAMALIDELKAYYNIDLYHDSGYVPDPALRSPDFASHDFRLFSRNASVLDYHAVLYQVGMSSHHNFLAPMLGSHPGIVTLHDVDDPLLTTRVFEQARAVVVHSPWNQQRARTVIIPAGESWARVAARYVEVIERVHAERPVEGASGPRSAARLRADGPAPVTERFSHRGSDRVRGGPALDVRSKGSRPEPE